MRVFLSLIVTVIGAHGALFSTDDFDYNVYLDEDEVFQLLWTKLNDTHIEFGVICDNPGWCAIGISPNGKMPGSDIAFFWVDDSDTNNIYLQDRFAESRSVPVYDEEQDLTYLEGSQEDDITYIHFIREINACDSNDEDVSIAIGTSRVCWAYNNNDPTQEMFDEDSIEWHGTNAGTKSVNLLINTQSDVDLDYDNLMYADVRMPSTIVPSDSDTTYYCGVAELPRLETTHHIVAIEALIDEGNEAVVHHMIAYHCPPSSVNQSHIGLAMDCDDFAEMGNALSDCSDGEPLYGWAIGGEIFEFPSNVGMEMGGDINDDKTVHYIVIETHWDNPNYESGIVDSSGFRVWYTDELRDESASGFWVGFTVWEYVHFIPPGLKSMTINAYCEADCLEYAMPEDGVTIFASMLHAHTHGIALKASIIRNNEEITIIDENENYDFDYQTSTYLSNPIKLLPGDTIYSQCTYSTLNDTTTVYAGESTQEEMCLIWLTVYPAIELKNCLNSWDWDKGYYDWYLNGFYSGYVDGSSFLWIGDSDDAIDYYKELWYNESQVNVSRTQICRAGNDRNYSYGITPGDDYGFYPFSPPQVNQWYEYPDYCNNKTQQGNGNSNTEDSSEADDANSCKNDIFIVRFLVICAVMFWVF